MTIFFIRSSVLVVVAFIFLSGCSGPNIHKNVLSDDALIKREWVLESVGDRSGEFSNPIIVGETLIYGTRGRGLSAIYPRLAAPRWKLQIPGGVSSPMSTSGTHVFFAGGDGNLYSVNIETGNVSWKFYLGTPYASKPALNGGRLFVTAANDIIYALDGSTGKWLWHYKRRSQQSASIMGSSEPLVLGSEVIAGLSDGYLVGLQAEDGNLKWERKLHQGGRFVDVDAKPIERDGKLYIASYDGGLYCMEKESGKVLWRIDAPGTKQVLFDNSNLYFASSYGFVGSIDPQTGRENWRFNLDGGTPTNFAFNQTHLIFGSSYQYLYAIKKDSGQPDFRWNAGYGSGFYGSPTFDDLTNRLYIISQKGTLYSFSVPPKNS